MIPQRMRDRPLFHGMAVPFIAHTYEDGKPDFKVNDIPKVIRCALERLCGLCGTVMGSKVYFIGGERSAAAGRYLDPPMHEQCARYAISVCPFLIGSKDYADVSQLRDGTPVQRMEGTVKDTESLSLTCCDGFNAEPVNGGTGILFSGYGRRWSEVFWTAS